MNVFSTDNTLQFNFNTGANVEHVLLVGVDYSWTKVGKRYATPVRDVVDLYDIEYDALATYHPTGPLARDSHKHLGIYIQHLHSISDRFTCLLAPPPTPLPPPQ